MLARLLALNAERYEEVVRLGLHSKAGKQAAKLAAGAAGASGKRRVRQAKNAQGGETASSRPETVQTQQMGLGL